MFHDFPILQFTIEHKEVMVRSKARSSWRVSVAWATSSHDFCHATKDSCRVHLKPSNWFDTFVDGQSRIGSKSNGLIWVKRIMTATHDSTRLPLRSGSDSQIESHRSFRCFMRRHRQGLPICWAVDCVAKICPKSLKFEPTSLHGCEELHVTWHSCRKTVSLAQLIASIFQWFLNRNWLFDPAWINGSVIYQLGNLRSQLDS